MARGDRVRGRTSNASTNNQRHVALSKSSSSYTTDSYESNKSSDLFREAEDFIRGKMNTLLDEENQAFIRDKMNNILGIGYACGAATKKTARRAFNDDDSYDDSSESDIDEGIAVNWRMDPIQSMSDWTLVVRTMKDPTQPTAQVYHLHKAVLAFGERKSGFFEKSFANHQSMRRSANGAITGSNNTSELRLDSRIAKFVPVMLDFIYSDKLDLDVNSAPGLRQLASQFDVRNLYALVSSFIQNDLSEKTVISYMNEAELVKDKELANVALQYAIQCFDLIPDSALGGISPHVFQQMMSNPKLFCPSSERLSQRVATFVRAREDTINEETFFFLTHANIMPVIDPSEAIWLLSFGASNFINTLVDESMGGYEASLKRRCIVAASKDWETALLKAVQHSSEKRQEGEVEGQTNDGSPVTRRRLFLDRDHQDVSERGMRYLNLPDDIRVELLEEALLKAATASEDHGNNRRNRIPAHPGNTRHYGYNAGANNESFHSVDYRSDVSKRDTQKGVREKTWY